GKTFADDPDFLTSVARSGEVFRPLPFSHRGIQPIWPWLVALAGVVLFFDVAVRRISIDPANVSAAAVALWARLRGPESVAMPADPGRLRRRETPGRRTPRKDKTG